MHYASIAALLLCASCGALPSSSDLEREFMGDDLSGDSDTSSGGDHQDNDASSDTDTDTGDDLSGDSDTSSGGDHQDNDASSDTDTVVAQKLQVVRADGTKIGFLNFVGEMTIGIWDADNDLVFFINDTTGYVAGGPMPYYTLPDCAGDEFVAVTSGSCSASGLSPARRRVYAWDVTDLYGVTEPSSLRITTGALQTLSSLSTHTTQCITFQNPTTMCGLYLEPTTLIPKAFPLPITIEEE